MAPKKSAEKKAKLMIGEKPEEVPQGLHIIEIYIENIKRVKLAHIRPKGNLVQISGKNGSGKTSVLDAISWAFEGLSDVPSQPVRTGERTGTIKMDLGEFVVTRYFTRIDPAKSKKEYTYLSKLLVEGKDRAQYPSPQKLLTGLMGRISCDALAFMRVDENKQFETLRNLVTFDIDVDELDRAQREDYQARRDVGRDLDFAKKRLAGLEAPDPNLPAEPIDTEALAAKLREAFAHNAVVAERRIKKERLNELATETKAKAVKLRADARELLSQAEDLDGRTAEIVEEYKRQEPSKLEEIYKKIQDIPAEAPIDTNALSADLTQANTTNATIQRAANYREIERQVQEADAKWTEIDTRMTEREETRTAAIARAKMPFDGLTIGTGEGAGEKIYFQGLPFSQASNADQIRVSMAMAMAANPKLRVLRITDGALLDEDSLQLVADAAAKNGFQVWIERVDSTGSVGVVMEDGEARGEEVVEVTQ